jgi:hypothetical protein
MQRRKLLFALVLTLRFVGSASAGDPLDTDSLTPRARRPAR